MVLNKVLAGQSVTISVLGLLCDWTGTESTGGAKSSAGCIPASSLLLIISTNGDCYLCLRLGWGLGLPWIAVSCLLYAFLQAGVSWMCWFTAFCIGFEVLQWGQWTISIVGLSPKVKENFRNSWSSVWWVIHIGYCLNCWWMQSWGPMISNHHSCQALSHSCADECEIQVYSGLLRLQPLSDFILNHHQVTSQMCCWCVCLCQLFGFHLYKRSQKCLWVVTSFNSNDILSFYPASQHTVFSNHTLVISWSIPTARKTYTCMLPHTFLASVLLIWCSSSSGENHCL